MNMRHLTAAMAVVVLTTAASAQYKTPGTPQGSPAIPLSPNPNVQITTGAPAESIESARRITREEAIKMVAANKAVYVDVRTKDQYDLEHIKGAISIPLGELQARVQELPKNKLLITYCACSAEQTAARAVLDLKTRGVKDAAALQGGWLAWKEVKLPTESVRKTVQTTKTK